MSITETLGALGSWEIQLRDETPDELTAQLGFFGHIAIIDGPVDVAAVGEGLLNGARYVGVLRAKDKDTGRTLSGSGLVFWLGDEDGKGDILETEISLTTASLSTAVHAILDPSNAVTVGSIHSIAGTYTGKHQFQSRREALSIICDAFNAEFRVNNNGSVDVGTAAQLYNTEAPDTIVVRKGAGTDMDLVALGGKYEVGESAYDYSTKAVLLGQTIGVGDAPDVVFATGSATAVSVPYLNLRGNTVKMVRTISESGTTSGSVSARAQLALNRFNRVAVSLKVTAEEFETEGNFVVGDNVYVYDPDTGIVNAANEVSFRGEVLHPDIVRASGITWPVVQGMTVAFRTQAGVWLDLTPFVTWETGGNELTVGDLPKSLTKPGDSVVQQRLDAVRADASIPNPPTSLVLTTFSTLNAQGVTGAVIHASWTAPTLNTDGSVITDLSHYIVQYRWTARSPQWQEAPVTADTERDIIVTPGLPYEVRVAAVDLGGKLSAWTSTGSITSASDAIAPNPPADPVVTSYLGQLRIEYVGTDSTGNPMATDTNRIDVHVGTTVGFTATDATRVSSITPFAKGVAYATAPYGSTRYVRLIAVDHSGNASASSAVVSGATTQVADGDVASMSVGKLTAGTMSADVVVSGRFATALTGDRREVNAVGFQAYNASNVLTVSIDGSTNLLTGTFKTALSGRRIEILSGGSSGQIDWHAPDGTNSRLQSGTDEFGNEALRLGVPIASVSPYWNNIQVSSGQAIYGVSGMVSWAFGGGSGAQQYGVFYVPTKGTSGTPPAAQTRFVMTQNNTLFYTPATTGSSTQVLRMGMSNAATTMYVTSTYDFLVADQTTSDIRFYIDGNGPTYNYFPTGSEFNVFEGPSTGTTKRRFYLDGTITGFAWGTDRLDISASLSSDESVQILMFKPDGFGSRILHKSVASTGAGHRIEFRDASGTILEELWASAFSVGSSAATKEEIAALEPGALDKIRAMGVKRYRRKGGRGPDGRQLPSGAPEIGLIAEEMPPEVSAGDGTMVNLYPLVSLLLAAVQELADATEETP